MMMKKLRWAMDCGFWDIDMSTPVTLDGLARPFPGDPLPLPLGLSRGAKLSRPKQIDFFQRFMAAPFVPSFAGECGLSLQRVLSLPLPSPIAERWFAMLLGQFNVRKFLTSIKNKGLMQSSESSKSKLQSIIRHLSDKSLYAFNLSSELLVTSEDTLNFSFEAYGEEKNSRKRAILHHKFPHHTLTVEAAAPELFVDQDGNYWDVPFSVAADLASVASDSGASYHLCFNHVSGSPLQIGGEPTSGSTIASLLGLCAKIAVSFKKNIDIWRSEGPKLKMVQPYDILLSNPHISAAAILGTVVTGSLGNDSSRTKAEDKLLLLKDLGLQAKGANSSISADLFASVVLSAQYGNFQRLLLDLTRFNVRMDFPLGSKFLSGAIHMAYDLYNSQVIGLEAVEAVCPNTTLSFQQQIAGPFSLRVDCGVELDLKNRKWYPRISNPLFAVEYALQVLGSAKAVAWYSPKQREFMIELRFFEA